MCAHPQLGRGARVHRPHILAGILAVAAAVEDQAPVAIFADAGNGLEFEEGGDGAVLLNPSVVAVLHGADGLARDLGGEISTFLHTNNNY